jgi:PadR family transcriptional regulator, regulatory protein PadR
LTLLDPFWPKDGSAGGSSIILSHARRLRHRYFFSIINEMAKREFMGGFELLVLLALIRLGDEAYGVPISEAIEESSGKEVALGSVYITLERLEQKGFVSSRLGEPTAERGGRAKTYFRITARGLREVRQARRTLMNLWQGVPQLQGGAL